MGLTGPWGGGPVPRGPLWGPGGAESPTCGQSLWKPRAPGGNQPNRFSGPWPAPDPAPPRVRPLGISRRGGPFFSAPPAGKSPPWGWPPSETRSLGIIRGPDSPRAGGPVARSLKRGGLARRPPGPGASRLQKPPPGPGGPLFRPPSPELVKPAGASFLFAPPRVRLLKRGNSFASTILMGQGLPPLLFGVSPAPRGPSF